MRLGDVVVSGFSGTLALSTGVARPAGKSATDLTFIDPDGPSARVIGTNTAGFIWDGRLVRTTKIFDVLAKDVGQIFGVAFDDATPPNIYLAATALFGLNIVKRGPDGAFERMKKGGPGAGWMKGQFGLNLQGGPGAVYKIDGRTGVASLFSNVTLDGGPNPGPGLGNLAYDAGHKQLFVSDLYTGMIHRLDLSGNDLGHFDHGLTALAAGNLAQVTFDPNHRPDIGSPRFDSEQPESWGFAPAARRVWAVAVHDGRLYYSVAAGAKIWSVGILQDGGFAADPRWEYDVPVEAGPWPVSDIAFSYQGTMILAQRGAIAGAYDYAAFTQPGEPKVLRVWPKGPGDPMSPGRWKLLPEEYAIGFAGDYRNTNGGVALGYGRAADGAMLATACEATLWSTGQNLRNDPALRDQLASGGPLVVHGLQANPANLVRPANEPPTISHFIDYDDKFDDARASGHMGSVRIFAQPCAGAVAISRPAIIASPVGGGRGGGGVSPPPPPDACFCPATPIPASGPTNYITNGNFATSSLAGWTQGGTYILFPVTFHGWSIPTPIDTLTGLSPLVPIAAGGAAYFVDDHAVNQSLSQSVTLPAGNYEVGFDLFVPDNGAKNPNDATMSAVIAGVTVLPTVSASSIISAETVNGVYTPKWKHYNAFFSTCGGTYTANFDFNSFGGPASGGVANAAKDFLVDRVYIIDSTTAGTNISCTGSLKVKKEVTTHGTLIPWPNPGPLFPMTLTCTAPPQSWSFSLNANGTYTANNIPFGETCTVAEGPMPPFPPNLCPRGTVPMWLPAPTITPASVVINGTIVTMVVHNSVTCEKPGELTVTKKVSPDPRGIGNTLTFPIVATCTNPNATYNLNVNGNTSTLPFALPVGSICTFTETQPALPAGCTWLAPIFSPASVTIASGLNMETVTNGYTCGDLPIDVGIEKTGGTTPFCPAPYYGFTIKVTNGPNPWPGTGNIVVKDTVPANMTFNTIGGPGWSCVPPGGPAGTVIMCTYTGTGPTANQVLAPINISATAMIGPPFPPYVNCASVAIPSSSGYVDSNAANNNFCTPPVLKPAACTCPPPQVMNVDGICVNPPPVCTAPQVLNVDGICACPAPMLPGAVAGQCVCPRGTVEQNGKCVNVVGCPPPLVPGAVPAQCVCPPGSALRNGKCVSQPKRDEPKRKQDRNQQWRRTIEPGGIPGSGIPRGPGR